MRRTGRHDPGRDADGRAALIDTLVAAESAVQRAGRGDAGPQVIARAARSLTEAQTVWLRITPDARVVRVGRRDRREQSGRPDSKPSDRGPVVVTAGVHREPLGGGGEITFCFDPADPDPSPLVAATSKWVDLRLDQRSWAGDSERAARAELRALRAQISPHFAFNAMGAIAALMRTDPERAHSLLLDFADYTRYSFRSHGEYTTLAEELRSIEIYLSLERARFGDRLSVRVTVPPEVLAMAIPFLVLQPLVENAIRHGIEPLARGGRVSVTAQDVGSDVRIEVEDDGAGADPAMIEGLLGLSRPGGPADGAKTDHVGLRNIDERLRAVFGDAHGLVVETAPGAGTKITVTIPKYRPHVTL